MRAILWIAFIILVSYMGHQAMVVKRSTNKHYALITAEFADSTQGKSMFREWKLVPYGGRTILDLARSNTHTDFLFIVDYTLLILLCSYLQMQNEKNVRLNALLRLNFLLALIVAGLDITENLKILYNIRHVEDPGLYCSPYWVSSFKWIILGWLVLIYLVSITKSQLNFNNSNPAVLPLEPHL